MVASDWGMLVIRVVVGLIFAAHGAQKAFGWWSGPGFAGWRGAMEKMGIRPAGFWAAVSMAAELVAGLLLAFGLFTPFAVAALIGQELVIIVHAHLPRGFWNSKGGFEYPLSLAAGVVAVAIAGAGAVSLDAAFGLQYPVALRVIVIAVGLVGGLIAVALPRVSTQTSAAAQQSR